MSTTRPVDSIIVVERHRRDLGDIARLAADLGLLHPVVVTPEGKLVAGARRLAAARLLGWTEIPVTVVNINSIVRGEYAENVCQPGLLLHGVALYALSSSTTPAIAVQRVGRLPLAAGTSLDRARAILCRLRQAPAVLGCVLRPPREHARALPDGQPRRRANFPSWVI